MAESKKSKKAPKKSNSKSNSSGGKSSNSSNKAPNKEAPKQTSVTSSVPISRPKASRGDDNAVRVAVRVRPFNQREKDRKAVCCLKMSGAMTQIMNPEAPNEEPKKFSFDFSYWSHDGFQEAEDGVLSPAPGSNYADQIAVFNDLGQGVLDNAFAGYNCSLFAYGQTGAGKSYSMVGYGNNRGIVPITCDTLFQTMDKNTDSSLRYQVTFSMLEIYNEQVRDLLSKDNPKGGLPVRQNPKLGLFYVQGLKSVPVGSYKEIEKRMEQGTASRTVASTQMNATSSRAHTVVTIIFDQISKNDAGQETKKSSVINLVDLAGSERAESTGATGDRLKEGANINKSLSALGNVISALADLSMGKKKVMVPYRDSVLTKLLQNALGGNSKTIMIAALSPADINYDETLGTLRYADRAKKIKNKAVVNENPMDKLIRELREENDRLKKSLSGDASAMVVEKGLSPEEIEKMKKEMEEEIRSQLMANQQALAASDSNEWQAQLQAAEAESGAMSSDVDRKGVDPHIINMNEDPMLSGVIVHFVSDEKSLIGRKDADHSPNITLSGLSIQKEHAVIENDGSEVTIKPASQGAKTKVNGMPLTGPRALQHMDRILFGSNHHYVFKNPKKPTAPDDTPKDITWDFVQKELAQAKGFALDSSMSPEQQKAQSEVLDILPHITEANAISEELNKYRSFEVVLVSAAAQESTFQNNKDTTMPDQDSDIVFVKMKNLLNDNSWLWERGKFMNRKYIMQDLYGRWMDGDESVNKIPKEEDPFWEPLEDVLIGTANIFLQSLAYGLDFDDRITVTDYKGQEEGHIFLNVTPCTPNGKPLDEDYFVDDPKELLGKPYHFKVTIRSAEVVKSRFSKGLHVRYRVFKENDHTITQTIKGTLSPEFNHSKLFTYESVTQEHLDFFETGCITMSLYGTQQDVAPDPKLGKMSTKEVREMENISKPTLNRKGTSFGTPQNEQAMLKSDFILLQRKYERLASKEKRLQNICEEWANKPADQKQFDPFYNAVSAVAKSTGTKLKTRVQVLNKRMSIVPVKQLAKQKQDDDTVSLFVFGEDEETLSKEASKSDGVIGYEKLVNVHYTPADLRMLAAHKAMGGGASPQTSKACVIQ